MPKSKKETLSELQEQLDKTELDYSNLQENIQKSKGNTRLELEEWVDFFEIQISSIRSQIENIT